MFASYRKFAALSLIFSLLLTLGGCPPSTGGNGTASQEILGLEVGAFNGINAERIGEGLDALTVHYGLRLVARAHSEDMAARDYFDHVNPDGQDPFDRMADAGITSYSTAGENIFYGYNQPDIVTSAVDGWMNSPDHYENIMTEAFTHTGMGVAEAQNNEYYFTQLFMGLSKSGTIEKVKVVTFKASALTKSIQ